MRVVEHGGDETVFTADIHQHGLDMNRNKKFNQLTQQLCLAHFASSITLPSSIPLPRGKGNKRKGDRIHFNTDLTCTLRDGSNGH